MEAVSTMETARRPWLGLAALCLLPYLGWWLTGLMDLDEGFYGAITREMIRSSDWIVPRLSGEPWFEKPILVYWLAAPAVIFFGDDFGPRLPSVVCSLLTAWALFRFARPRFGETGAMLAAAMWSTSLLAVGIGRMMLTDSAFVLALSGCLFFFWKSLTAAPRWRIAAAACLGVAVLAKGPAAGAFFLLIAGLVYWWIPSLRTGFKGGWLAAIPVGLLVMAAWYVPVSLREPQAFLQEFIITQNLGRFGGGDLAHRVPWWAHPIYYPAVLALGFAAWLPSVMRRRRSLVAVGPDPDAALTQYLLIWAAVIFVFFTISGSKLVHYILPALPPICLLAARALARDGSVPQLTWKRHAFGSACAVCALANIGFWFAYQNGNAKLHHAVRNDLVGCQSLVVYKGDSSESRTDISLTLNETSRPSIFFYFHGPGIQTADPKAALALGEGSCIVGRGEPDEELRASYTPVSEIEPWPDGFYLYRR